MEIADNIQHLKQSLPTHVRIVAVSKTVPEADLLEAYHCNHRIFGENRVQELVRRYSNLPRDIEWHMIGHLQTNKIKYIAPFIAMIHSVDNLNLLSVINQEALKNNRIIRCLLQIRIAKEETKYGLSPDSAVELLSAPGFQTLSNVRICGLMGMATFTEDTALIRSEFRFLAGLFKQLKADYFRADESFSELSMGMSGDYPIAVEEGATLLRIGTLIFGQRT
jgi:pyridoxal phosphate enzyme (YggS family)